MTKTINIYEAKTSFSRLIERVAAGESITIARNGRPVARLCPLGEEKREVAFGVLAGVIQVADDFDAPLPEEVRRSFEEEG